MHIFRWGSRLIESSTPAGLLLGGAALVLALSGGEVDA